ncbi:zeta toxin family protein [Bifidobacterium sp. ESL0690]|uniref:zeta toxin family protein n=1 Tax=Bifidobacterium sp. ESL0690 TaxID=2983214 RepID=UPI0023F9CCF9|nr:zeta toxin family protein [Bifidobacterium sp. ESL0690]WEV46860.1 zeta toxin family protein [Bifidobacterium sp. ESL0690]
MSRKPTEQELEEIFDDEVVQELGDGPAEDSPLLIVVVAQPGAGKTMAIAGLCQKYPDAVRVDSDAYRRYHPRFRKLMMSNPKKMADETGHAAGVWAGMARDWLCARRRSLIVEATFSNPETAKNIIAPFRQAGYRIQVVALAVPAELSLMGTLSRYAHQAESKMGGRWVKRQAHDKDFDKMPNTLDQQIRNKQIDEVTVLKRDGQELCHVVVSDKNCVQDAYQVGLAIAQGRDFTQLSGVERDQWDAGMKTIQDFIAKNPDEDRVKSLFDKLSVDGKKAGY